MPRVLWPSTNPAGQGVRSHFTDGSTEAQGQAWAACPCSGFQAQPLCGYPGSVTPAEMLRPRQQDQFAPIIPWLGRGPGPDQLTFAEPTLPAPGPLSGSPPRLPGDTNEWPAHPRPCLRPRAPGERRLAALATKPAGQGRHYHSRSAGRDLCGEDVLIPFHPLALAVSCWQASERQVFEIGAGAIPPLPPSPRWHVLLHPSRCPGSLCSPAHPQPMASWASPPCQLPHLPFYFGGPPHQASPPRLRRGLLASPGKEGD